MKKKKKTASKRSLLSGSNPKKLTIKDVREYAGIVKANGLKGRKAWNRVELYMKGFENVHFMWDELHINRGISYTPLSKILKSDYFY